ncbi:MAG: 4-hydroxythreonine-4-phosphate dehydrogenase PdxA [Deltaproteobacteria bacterium]|nr:4-hydroxythreonine-4-phosphate dehydrogenase PdxA [Deltaproteobacteria bacterium]
MLRLAVSTGCPCGVGPEVSVLAALSEALPEDVELWLYGDPGALSEASALRGARLTRRQRVVPTSDLAACDRRPGNPTERSGLAQLHAVDAALGAVLDGTCDALVTAPVSKHAIHRAGVPFTGHTEYLAARSGAPRAVMFFVGPRLRVSLVTTHLPLAGVSSAVTREAVTATVTLTAQSLQRDLGVPSPRLGVCGLNPHAGEQGLLGGEERAVLLPALEDARGALGAGVAIEGPAPSEVVLRRCRDGLYDAAVAMYHDQATIASKLLDFGDAVNVTLGLPFVRTSVDHGTAYDIAGQGLADPRAMSSAVVRAAKMVRARAG